MPRTALAVLIVIVALLATMTGARSRAQEGSPTAELATGDDCSVPGRSDDEIAALNATASAGVATPPAVSPIAMPEGAPVDAATLNALDDTLTQITACAKGGNLSRLLALYSDDYVTTIALAPEPVPIVPGHPSGMTPGASATPAPVSNAPARVEEAVKLPDGRIAAKVSAEGIAGTAEIVFFVFERDRWVVDEMRPVLPEGPLGGDLPFPVQAAVAAAAAALGIDPSAVTVVSYEPKDWGDTSLGCPKPGEVYAQVITPGYRVVLSANGQTLEYHTDGVDRAVRCDAS